MECVVCNESVCFSIQWSNVDWERGGDLVMPGLLFCISFKMCEFLVCDTWNEFLYRAQACIQKRMIEAVKNKQSTSSVSREWTWYLILYYLY